VRVRLQQRVRVIERLRRGKCGRARRLVCGSGGVDSLNGLRGWARKDERKNERKEGIRGRDSDDNRMEEAKRSAGLS
jgi:hypothetical protein